MLTKYLKEIHFRNCINRVSADRWNFQGGRRLVSSTNYSFYDQRRTAVRNSMRHAWEGYRKYAFGKDELLPVTKKWSNK
ncbi:Mannosyl-oligosaccharide 1,2-alpha-mannosidase MNS3 [Smittium culicis]|uniref:Mannosyl-oligosaccharide 1,2-alpha-mannosidase MNS3 n=1 Tax=Smittium culicis TaxID=133412 RepID=A0A1R1XLB6_9FUNG|nr:Mannosyl-oligosaccharide 1,2-alpha-mannosidase MNS3 [Smittium culicis]